MNITEGSANKWLNLTSYNANISSSSNSNTSSDNSTTNNTDQGSPSPQLWDVRWFALLSGPLLFGTIILPLVTGPAIRYLCQSYVTLRVYWRLGFSFLAIAYPGLTYGLWFNGASDYGYIGGLILTILPSISISLYALYQIYAWRGKARWLVLASLILLVLFVWMATFLWGPSIPFGYLGWIAIFLFSLFTYRRESTARKRADTRHA